MSTQETPTTLTEVAEPISYRAEGVAKVTGLSLPTVRRRIADGSLPSRLIGGCRIILREDLERFLREGS